MDRASRGSAVGGRATLTELLDTTLTRPNNRLAFDVASPSAPLSLAFFCFTLEEGVMSLRPRRVSITRIFSDLRIVPLFVVTLAAGASVPPAGAQVLYGSIVGNVHDAT